MTEFKEFPKIARLSKPAIVTEKIDGTNASVYIPDDLSDVIAGSRSRWITPDTDNYGFAAWVRDNRDELLRLGPGHHFGEWWGEGIQRRYGIKGKRFSLFNVDRWGDDEKRPACCHVVPVILRRQLDEIDWKAVMAELESTGSLASPGFMRPEGICVYLAGPGIYLKKTFEKDGGKWA